MTVVEDVDISQAVILQGRLANYQGERVAMDLILRDVDHRAMGLTAVAAALAGSGGAVGLAAFADTREEMTKVQFDLNGRHVQGWLTWSPFKEDDEVEVIAEQGKDGRYQAFAILRPADRVIALYPHCSRGRFAHYKASARWALKFFLPVYLAFCLLMVVIFLVKGQLGIADYFSLVGGGGAISGAVFAVVSFRIASKFMPFVRLAENLFTVLGWKNVKSIDLPARTKAKRKAGDTPGLGTLYFRY
jgi:hypothetical protein